jgi:hypothetical protein
MKYIILITIAMFATPAAAEVLQLPNRNAESVKAICAKQHGVFWDHGGLFGCTMERGTVQCDGAHCVGYPKHRRPTVRPPSQRQWEYWPQQNQW